MKKPKITSEVHSKGTCKYYFRSIKTLKFNDTIQSIGGLNHFPHDDFPVSGNQIYLHCQSELCKQSVSIFFLKPLEGIWWHSVLVRVKCHKKKHNIRKMRLFNVGFSLVEFQIMTWNKISFPKPALVAFRYDLKYLNRICLFFSRIQQNWFQMRRSILFYFSVYT